MKFPLVTVVFVLLTGFAFAQEVPDIPEPKKDSATVALEQESTFRAVEQSPSFPGGMDRFNTYVANHLEIPQLTALFGFTGRIVVGFTVDKRGKLTDINPISNSGLGLENEIASIIAQSPSWKPGIQNGIPVDVKYTIPFKFNFQKPIIDMAELKGCAYQFTFQIKDKTYSIDQAEPILGKTFPADKIDYARSFTEQPEENKKAKKYLIQIKD
ncbi:MULTISPECIES: energy transducer TonB [unclassified Mucilaginibacter]|uniref:energy transducer TonB n=1 Tax=unclassified Mucilaginibacter TaxID=2617802 RepID=UPI00339520B5